MTNQRKGDAQTYTGRPCKYGHDGTRYMSSKNCIECARAAARKQRGIPVQSLSTVSHEV